MYIFFGKYRIPFKSYSSMELGFEDYFPNETKIRVVQDCAHFFFIPCFGMGKDYFYQQEGKYYPLPHDLVLRLRAQQNIRTPVFAYALPLMILLAIGGLLINGAIEHHHRIQLQKTAYSSSLEKMEYALDHLDTHHVIKLKNPKDPYGENVYLQVIHVGEEVIDCRKIYWYNDQAKQAYVVANAEPDSLHPKPTIKISKQDLSAAVSRNITQYAKGYRPAIPLLNDGNVYYVESISNPGGNQ